MQRTFGVLVDRDHFGVEQCGRHCRGPAGEVVAHDERGGEQAEHAKLGPVLGVAEQRPVRLLITQGLEPDLQEVQVVKVPRTRRRLQAQRGS